jgi:hypothetical protein
MATQKPLTLAEVEEMSAEDLAERFKEGDLELCVEPLSEWGSDLETLFQKLEKGVMQWYETGVKRSFVLCFAEAAPEKASVTTPDSREEAKTSPVLTTPAVAS